MKLKSLIAIPVVAALVAYIGVKGFIYYKVKTELDKAIQAAAPVLQIQYGGIGSDLNGKISVEKILVTPTGSYDEIKINKATLSGKGPGFLFDLMNGLDSNEPPEQLQIRFERLVSPIKNSFFKSIVSQFGQKIEESWKSEKDVCSLASILSGAGLKELGFPDIIINGGMGYSYDKDLGKVQLSLDYDLSGVEASYIKIGLSGVTTAGAMGLGAPPAIEDFSLQREMEPGYIKQMVTMCSGNTGKTPEQFIKYVVSRSERHYLKTLGFIPGPGLKDMFQQLLTKPAPLEIKAEPSSKIDPKGLTAYKPSDLVSLLGLSVTYDQKMVDDLSFRTTVTKKPRSSRTTRLRSSKMQEQQTALKQKPRKRPRMRYIKTEIDDLSKYVNYRVRVYTVGNSIPKQGVLISIDDPRINVEELLYNGKMTVHLHRDRIERIDVLRIYKPN